MDELREKALDAYQGDKKLAWEAICKPHPLHQGKSLFELSEKSDEGHREALHEINNILYSLG